MARARGRHYSAPRGGSRGSRCARARGSRGASGGVCGRAGARGRARAARTWRGAKSASQLRGLLERGEARALVLDVSAAGQGALDVLRERRARGDALPALVIAAFGDVEAAERARALGGCTRDRARGRDCRGAARGPDASWSSSRQPPTPVSASLAPAMLWKADARGDFTHFTRRLLEFLGLSQAQAPAAAGSRACIPRIGRAGSRPGPGSVRGAARDRRSTCGCAARRRLPLGAASTSRPADRAASSGRCSRSTTWWPRATRARDESARLEAASRELEELAFAAAHDLQEPLRSVERELRRGAARGARRPRARAAPGGAHARACCATWSTTRARHSSASRSSRPTSRRRSSGRSRTCAPRSPRARPRSRSRRSRACSPTRSRSRACSRTWSRTRCASAATSAPVISVGAEPRESDVLVSVRDNGIGIPRAHHETIFRVFERLHGVRAPGHGHGPRDLPAHPRAPRRPDLGRVRAARSGATFYFTVPSAAS